MSIYTIIISGNTFFNNDAEEEIKAELLRFILANEQLLRINPWFYYRIVVNTIQDDTYVVHYTLFWKVAPTSVKISE